MDYPVDFLDNPLRVGDIVCFTIPKYVGFVEGTILSMTKLQAKVSHPSKKYWREGEIVESTVKHVNMFRHPKTIS